MPRLRLLRAILLLPGVAGASDIPPAAAPTVRHEVPRGDCLACEFKPDNNTGRACPLALPAAKGGSTPVWCTEADKKTRHRESPPPPVFRIDCRKPGSLTEIAGGGEAVLSIQGDGIGRATVNLLTDPWPARILLRARLRGLESLAISNDRVTLHLAVLSHGNHAAVLHLKQGGKEGPQLAKDSPYWTEVRRLAADGKPVAGLPPDGGWFELVIPRALLGDTKTLKFEWVDFFRG